MGKIKTIKQRLEGVKPLSKNPSIDIKQEAERFNIKLFNNKKSFMKNASPLADKEALWKEYKNKEKLLASGQYASARADLYKEAYIDYLNGIKGDMDISSQNKINDIVSKLSTISGAEFDRLLKEYSVKKVTNNKKEVNLDLSVRYTTKGVYNAPSDANDFLNAMEEVLSPDVYIPENDQELLDYIINNADSQYTKQLKRIGRKNIRKYIKDGDYIDDPVDIIVDYAIDKIYEGKKWRYGLSKEEFKNINELINSRLHREIYG